MILRLQSLALLATLLALPLNNVCAADDASIPSDAPISSIVASAKSFLAKGAHSDALTYFDAAITRDPTNYLAIFQRGATYLSIGRNAQASADFDKVLKIKPDFEAALLQRAKIKAKGGDWAAAKDDYLKAGRGASQEMSNVEEAQGAAVLAAEARRKQDWQGCVTQASIAIMTASTSLSLRQLRSQCRFEKGEVQEGVNDLNHVLQISLGSLEPFPQISSMLFYSLGDTHKGIEKVVECLQSDADYEPCKRLRRREKQLSKTLEKVRSLMDSRQFNSASKLLAGTGEDVGVLAEIKEDVAQLTHSSFIHPKAPGGLYATYVEHTCQCFREMNSPRKAAPFCAEALTYNPVFLHGLLHQAQQQLDAEDYDQAMATLNTAKENHPGSQAVQQKLQEVQVLQKRSKQKNYYKVLGVDRDADDRTIKRAYRNLVRQHHPDKSAGRGLTKEQAEKKMAQINEAYEVLSDSELKAKFDRGEDPNDPMAQQGGHPFQGSPFGGGGQQFFFQQSGFSGGGQRQFKFQQGPGGGGGGGGFPFGFPG
jgi:DnaJ homolog subfamily C member 3